MYRLYNYLSSNNLTEEDKIRKYVFEEADLPELVEHLDELLILADLDEPKEKPDIFDFSSSSTLSGGEYPCGRIECRIKHVSDLLSYAALYSNSVLIPNPFDFFYDEKYLNPTFAFTEKAENNFRNKIAGAILVVNFIEPAVRKDVMKINHAFHTVTHKELVETKIREDKITDELYEFVSDQLAKELEEDIDLEFNSDNELEYKGIDKYVSEHITVLYDQIPSFLDGYKDKLPGKIPSKELLNTPYFKFLINDSIKNLLSQKLDPFIGSKYNYLTDNRIEISMIDHLNNDTGQMPNVFRNIKKGLNHVLPLPQNIPFTEILNLREQESEAFIRYQFAIKEVLKVTEDCKTQEEFEEALTDIVTPEIVKIRQLFKKREGDIISSFQGKTILAGATTLLGIFDLNIPLTTGIVGTAAAAIDSYSKLKDVYTDLSKNPYYFYWKVTDI